MGEGHERILEGSVFKEKLASKFVNFRIIRFQS